MVYVVSGVWPGESDFGQELEAAAHRDDWLTIADVRFGSLADIRTAKSHVRFTPESDIKCDIWNVR